MPASFDYTAAPLAQRPAATADNLGHRFLDTGTSTEYESTGVAWITVPTNETIGGSSAASAFGGATVVDASKYATIDDAVTAANAVSGGCVLFLGSGLWTTSNLLTVNSGVSIFGTKANLRFNAAGAGLHIPDADAQYFGFTVDGMDVALGTNASGTGADALFKVGTGGGGLSGKAYFANITVRRVGAGGICMALHNLQNSNLYDLRTNDSAIGSVGLLIDNGCKNVNFFGAWPTNIATCVKITTSEGSQRTSKINFYTGLCEVFTVTAFRIEDAEQVLIDNVALNGDNAFAASGVHLVAGGNRDGTGAKAPSSIQVYGCESTRCTSFLQMDSPCVVHTGSLSPSGSTQTYKVETTNAVAKIIERTPNFSEGTAKFASVAGAVEQTVVHRSVPPKSVSLQQAPLVWTNMPAALTELNGTIGQRAFVDASRYTHARIMVSVTTVGAAGSKLQLKYRTTNGTFATFSTAGTSEIEVPVDALGTVKSAWVPLAAAAKADVVFAVGGISGDGAADPSIGNVTIEFY